VRFVDTPDYYDIKDFLTQYFAKNEPVFEISKLEKASLEVHREDSAFVVVFTAKDYTLKTGE
jgi:hypothetical protein